MTPRTALYRNTPLLALAVLLVVGGLAAPAKALNIILDFDSSQTYTDPYGVNRTMDLQPIMQAAEAYWEDIIEDSHTITIHYWWEDLATYLAVHNNITTVGGRETEANIRFDTITGGSARLWFFDSTPTDDSEFDMTQTLYRDLTATQKTDWFNGAPPEVFEAGYDGTAKTTAPASAKNGYDLLSVAIHELGHAMGMTSSVAGGEVNTDLDYDVPTGLVNGAVMATECYSASDKMHLACGPALMYPSIGTGQRQHATAADVLSMAAASSWTSIDLDRKDFLATGTRDWNTNSYWIGGMRPDTTEDAYIRLQGGLANVGLSAAGYAKNLFVGDADWVQTNAYRLYVAETTTIDGTGTQIFVETGGELETDDLVIQNSGELDMSGGLADVNGTLTVNTGTKITGNGTIDVLTSLYNNGLIKPDGGTLTLTTSAGTINLDGGGNGNVDCSVGSLTINGAITDAYDGDMIVGSGQTVTFNSGWILGTGGTLTFNGSPSIATVAGTNSEVRGTVTVNDSARFTSPVTFTSASSVSVATASDHLQLQGATTFSGGSFTGSGKLTQVANATVSDNTTIGVATYDWDGGGSVLTAINAGKTFTINSNQIDLSPTTDGFDGTVTLFSGATLAVNTTGAWRMEGTMNLYAGTVSGSEMDVYGTINALSGTSTISADVVFDTGTSVVVSGGATLALTGNITYQGSSYTGAGTLRQDGPATVVTNTTINVATFDWDGHSPYDDTTVNSGVTFTINSNAIESDPGGSYAGTTHVDGTLNVNTTGAWGHNGTLNLISGAVGGSQIDSNGTINASGGMSYVAAPVVFGSSASVTVASGSTLALNGSVVYRGGSYTGAGTLRQNGSATVESDTTISVATYDWDGLIPYDLMTIDAGATLTINSNVIEGGGNPYNGTTNVDGTLMVNTLAAWTHEGTLNLISGAVGGSQIDCNGTINASGGTSYISADVVFDSNTHVTVAGGSALQLDGNVVYRGGSYIGAGILRQNGDARVAADTTIDVATYDWDGYVPYDVMTIDPGVTFRINSNVVDTGAGIFDGTVEVDSAKLMVYTSAAWGMDGTMNLNNTAGMPLVYGSEILVTGTIHVSGGEAKIYARTDFRPGGSASLPGVGDILDLAGTTTYSGGTLTGLGLVHQSGDANVVANTTVSVAVFDMDGYQGVWQETFLQPGVTFTINADKIENLSNDGYDGNIYLNSATLAVNTAAPWQLDGTMHISGTSSVNGSEMIVNGSVIVGSTGLINAPVTFQSTGVVNLVGAGDTLKLNGATRFAGGTYTGGGTLVQNGDATVVADTTLGSTISYDWDGDAAGASYTTVQSGAIFTVLSAPTDPHNGKINVQNGASLVVNSASVWYLDGVVLLDGGTVRSDALPRLDIGGTLALNSGGEPAAYLRGVKLSGTGATQIKNIWRSITGLSTFWERAAGASIIHGAGAKIVVDSGGGLIVGGGADLFTFTATGTHIDVTNNGTLWVTTGPKVAGVIDGTGTTTVTSLSDLSVVSIDQGALNVYGDLTIRGASKTTSTVEKLWIDTSGQIDLMHNKLVVDYSGLPNSPIDDIHGWIAGGELMTSTVDVNKGLGYFDDTLNDQVLVMLTWKGDLDCDDDVDLDDLTIMGTFYNIMGGMRWYNGDVDGDGDVDLDDLTLLGTYYNATPAVPVSGVLPIPEPVTLSLLALGGLTLLRRGIRRRRRKS